MNLSSNFTLAEAMKSQTALRLGIDNRPADDLIPALTAVAENILEPARAHFGIPFAPSSWFRCRELNRAIGSEDGSQHVAGAAVDFEIPGVSNARLARWCRDNLVDFDQLILEFWNPDDPAAGWVHCSYVYPTVRRPRSEVLTIGTGGAAPGLPDAP